MRKGEHKTFLKSFAAEVSKTASVSLELSVAINLNSRICMQGKEDRDRDA